MRDVSKIIKKHLEYKSQTNKELRNNIIGKRLNEGQVDGLKDVKIIRHYTTGAALKSILKTGIIKASVSRGDKDWEGYDKLHDKKVISFHDARTDPEWDTIIKANERKFSIQGKTPTLGLHDDKICCCIEIDYDKLDKLIQDSSHLLNIYGRVAESFINLWNYIIADEECGQNGYAAFYGVKYDIMKLGMYAIENEDKVPELYNSIKYIWKSYNVKHIYKDKKAQLAWKKVEEIFKKYYPDKDLYEVKDYLGHKMPFIVHDFSKYVNYNLPKYYEIKYQLDDAKEHYEFYKNRKFSIFKDDEIEEFKDAVIKFDVIKVVKMLKKHGWRFGDSDIYEFNYYHEVCYKDKKYYSADLIKWIDQLARSKNRIINAKIEIRIPYDIKLDKDNCKIIIFNGICDATRQICLKKLPKKYYEKYNIEHIE